MRICRADFADVRLVTFLGEHLAELEPTAPEESRHALDLSGLQAPGVRLWVGLLDGSIVATGATAPLEPGHEELKSMRIDPAQRGRGFGRVMLAHLLGDARRRDIHAVWLETGSMDFFIPARSLYQAAGFVECPPFGAYRQDSNSTFMTMSLRD